MKADGGLSRKLSPETTRLAGLVVLVVGGLSVVVSIALVLRGDPRGLLFSALGLLVLWASILIDRDARGRKACAETDSEKLGSPRVPARVTRVVGLSVLILGGFLLVACLAHFFSDEPESWFGLANCPISILIVWMGLLIDRDRLQEEGRDRRKHEGVGEADEPKG